MRGRQNQAGVEWYRRYHANHALSAPRIGRDLRIFTMLYRRADRYRSLITAG